MDGTTRKTHILSSVNYYAIFLIFSLNVKFLYSQSSKDTTLILYFNSAVYKLDSSQIEQILKFEDVVNGVKDIIGYADSVGSIGYNKILTQKRALNVYQIILERFKPNNLYSYKGEEFPQNPDLALNRKVEITGYIYNRPSANFGLRDQLLDSFEVENVTFLPDKAILSSESISFIPILVQKVKSYRDVHFEIVGHVNYQSKRDSSHLQDLYKLSEERAKVIYQVLVENGISKGDLSYKGVGNSRPLIKNPKNDFEKSKNMRVQIFVLRTVRNN
jgi:outer membrane protein OmpA-like peptidoglycan-associated protein